MKCPGYLLMTEYEDYFGPAGLQSGTMLDGRDAITVYSRDVETLELARFNLLLGDVWSNMARAPRRTIVDHIKRMQSTYLDLLDIAGGVYFIPSQKADAKAYVAAFGGLVVFDSELFRTESDTQAQRLIRHELAHVYQHAAHMFDSGILQTEHGEGLADWIGSRILYPVGWRNTIPKGKRGTSNAG